MGIPATVNEIGKIHFEGNIVPHTWYQHIRFPNSVIKKGDKAGQVRKGKPDLVAITILSDIIYWYRPTIIRDEETGEVLGYKKKFHADKLQRSYQGLSEIFGITKGQAADACTRLEKLGLITKEFRTITTKTGLRMSNVLYLEPVAEEVKRISYPIETDPCEIQAGGVSVSKPIGIVLKGETNTEITPEISQREDEATPPPQIAEILQTGTLPGITIPVKEPSEHQAYFGALAAALRIPPGAASNGQAARLGKLAKRVKKLYTVKDVEAAGRWWYREDWRGKQNQAPKDDQLIETLEKLRVAREEDAKRWTTVSA